MADLSRITSAIRPLSPSYNLYTQAGLAIPGSGNLRGADRQQHGVFQQIP